MKRNVEEKIADIRRQIGSRDGTQAASPSQTGKRTLSPAARKKIAVASKPTNTKRIMSAAARKRIAAAQRKRWALQKAKKAS